MTLQTLQLSNGDTRYVQAGAGAPVLLLHGVGLQAEAWGPQIAALSADHRVIALNMPGHGGSDLLAAGADLPAYVAWAAEAIRALGIAPVAVAGHSMGAFIAAGLATALIAIPPMVMFVLHDYQRKRIFTFLDPESDPSGSGYHILQSKIALGSGGFFGKGYGLGSQSQLNFLPEKQTDFIFATLAEEFGFVGCFSVLFLYAAVIFMALRIASISHSHFGRLAAAGVTATFALYVLINGAMVMGLAPVVGVPMPMLSYGGTVMMTVMIGFGLVQSVRVHRYSEVTSGKGSFV